MKNIDFKQYLAWLITFILWVILFKISDWNRNLALVIFWIILSVWLFNISWILFYKVLKTKKEYQKILFSFLNIIILLTIVITTTF